MLGHVSQARIRAILEKLESFGESLVTPYAYPPRQKVEIETVQ